ncbi:hypothetical protein KC325_g127 [Hortaea werneckii]|nr:hypothetical protein KC325_g127 [Hortaea werneckii]
MKVERYRWSEDACNDFGLYWTFHAFLQTSIAAKVDEAAFVSTQSPLERTFCSSAASSYLPYETLSSANYLDAKLGHHICTTSNDARAARDGGLHDLALRRLHKSNHKVGVHVNARHCTWIVVEHNRNWRALRHRYVVFHQHRLVDLSSIVSRRKNQSSFGACSSGSLAEINGKADACLRAALHHHDIFEASLV